MSSDPAQRWLSLQHLGVVDVETSDLNERASVLGIGIVKLTDPDKRFYLECKPFPGCSINPASMAINGRKLDSVDEMALPTEAEAVVAAREWCRANGITLTAGQNPSFDVNKLLAAETRAENPAKGFLPHRAWDLGTMAGLACLLAGKQVPERGFSADDTYAFLGAMPEPKPHISIQGAWMEAAAMRRVITDIQRWRHPDFSLPGRDVPIEPLCKAEMEQIHAETLAWGQTHGHIRERTPWHLVAAELELTNSVVR